MAERAAPYLGPLCGLVKRVARALRMDRLPLVYWVGQTTVVARKPG